ncbi:MAG: DUF72 domain-containing protein, partial [Burkholderiaceae bacterium]
MRERAAPPDSLFDLEPESHAPHSVKGVRPDEALARLGRRLPADVFLGTSSWSFLGWQGIVYDGSYSESQLARTGLEAYSQHPLLRTVGIDRSYYQPLCASDYARYARQVPANFRFVVKAPARVTDAALRSERGAPTAANPDFLDASIAANEFVRPALEGLGANAGPLLFQFPALPPELTTGPGAHETIDRIGAFLSSLPNDDAEQPSIYAVELRNGELLTPRFIRVLRVAGARLAIGVHTRMPAAARQAAALRSLDAPDQGSQEWQLTGPLVARWNLGAGQRYDDARQRYAPFDRIVDPDIVTRGALAHLVHVAQRSSQPSFIIANNKAEGSAPLSLIELARAIV